MIQTNTNQNRKVREQCATCQRVQFPSGDQNRYARLRQGQKYIQNQRLVSKHNNPAQQEVEVEDRLKKNV